jgi:hypothetical protein
LDGIRADRRLNKVTDGSGRSRTPTLTIQSKTGAGAPRPGDPIDGLQVSTMKAVVVYESHWGNTARVAQAIADGIGPETLVLATDEADVSAVSGADLLVAGAPVLGFGLPTERMEAAVANSGSMAPMPPDTTHPSLRAWLGDLPRGRGQGAAFETRVRWSPGGATGAIERSLERAGYPTSGTPGKFIVTGRYGPLRKGELDRARRWGEALKDRANAV